MAGLLAHHVSPPCPPACLTQHSLALYDFGRCARTDPLHSRPAAPQVRALITGPEGTPYEAGCFLFDLFFPPAYPNVPPLMQLDTTGGGRVRFNRKWPPPLQQQQQHSRACRCR